MNIHDIDPVGTTEKRLRDMERTAEGYRTTLAIESDRLIKAYLDIKEHKLALSVATQMVGEQKQYNARLLDVIEEVCISDEQTKPEYRMAECLRDKLESILTTARERDGRIEAKR